MDETLVRVGVSTLYMLALVNPISKVPVLAGMAGAPDGRELRAVTARTGLAADGILIVMRLATPISAILSRHNILGALIRITGLIVMTIGAQMALDGIAAWQTLTAAN